MSQLKTCPRCDESVAIDTEACPRCGDDLEPSGAARSEEPVFCVNCDRELPAADAHCSSCEPSDDVPDEEEDATPAWTDSNLASVLIIAFLVIVFVAGFLFRYIM